MAFNLGKLTPITSAAQSLGNLILVTPQAVVGYQPQNLKDDKSPLEPAFLFDYEGEQRISLKSDITDHYVEDNNAVADHIALKPETITVRGFISELNDVVPSFLSPVKTAAEKLTTIGSYVPGLSATALLAYSEAFFLYQTAANLANAAVSSWNSLSNMADGSNGQSTVDDNGNLIKASAQNKQQTAFQSIYGYWKERRLFSVQTPWCVFKNMAIETMTVTQDADTNLISDFEIQFKILRTASSKTAMTGIMAFQGRFGAHASDLINHGSSSPGPSASSLSESLAGMA